MRLMCVLLCILHGIACTDSVPPAEFEAAALHELNYHYTWSDHDAVFENDLGYSIQIVKGAVSNYSIQLVPCEQESLVQSIGNWLISPAFAGHSSIEDDPSLLNSHYVESLPSEVSVDAGSVQVDSGRYCHAHYLVAKAPNDALGLPADWNMIDKSVYFELNYRAPESDEWVAMTVETKLAFGELLEIEPIDMATQGAHIVVTRSLFSLFDGIDFEQQSSIEIPWRVLENLVTKAVVSVN